jgi:hypothetical protein
MPKSRGRGQSHGVLGDGRGISTSERVNPCAPVVSAACIIRLSGEAESGTAGTQPDEE